MTTPFDPIVGEPPMMRPSSAEGNGVVGFFGDVCGNGVEVTLSAAFMPRAIWRGLPAARKWMNQTSGSKS